MVIQFAFTPVFMHVKVNNLSKCLDGHQGKYQVLLAHRSVEIYPTSIKFMKAC